MSRQSAKLFDIREQIQYLPNDELPTLLPGGAWVRVICAGVSPGAKLMFQGKGHARPVVPIIPGTTCVGVVELVADDVFGIEVGDYVVLDPLLEMPHYERS